MKNLDTVLVATSNSGKVEEFRRMATLSPFRLSDPAELGLIMEVEESGNTFEANAKIKALAYTRETGLPALADDSGLEVDALDGAPGIISARYGGPGLTDADRVRLLLDKMKDVPDGKRGARFKAALALCLPGEDKELLRSEGIMQGIIARAPMGESGFGYDPVFWLPAEGATTAMLDGPRKDTLSHRGKAMRTMLEILHNIYGA